MAKVQGDGEFDRKLQINKAQMDRLKIELQSYMSAFQSLPIPERVKKYRSIETQMKNIQSFLANENMSLVTNTGSKFEYENLKQRFGSQSGRWRKFCAKMEGVAD